MDLQSAVTAAINTQSGTPPYEVACAVCMLRGIDPHGRSMTGPFQNWQGVIAEQLMLRLMSEMVA